MEYMDDASSLEHAMIQRAKQQKIPINGSLELLPLCNMNCDMCYVRLTREEMEAAGRLRSLQEWLDLGQQMADAGTLFLLLTGGEPLLYPDFKILFQKLKQMGMFLTINTNGTLIDEDWADFFEEYKPRRINITLYGADASAYEKLCHYPEGFSRTIQGIRLLRERNVDVKVSCSATRQNQHDIEKIFALGRELNVPVHMDAYMMPAVRERTKPYDHQARLLPEDAARVALLAFRSAFSADIYGQYVTQTIERIQDPDFPRGDRHISCLAGNCSFTINWQGEMRPCVVLSTPSIPVFETGFENAWKEISAQTQEILINPTCTKCSLRPVCRTCAAGALLETGAYDGIPDYLCRYSEEYYRLLLEEQNRLTSSSPGKDVNTNE